MKQLTEGRVCLGSQFKDIGPDRGEGMEQECEAAGLTVRNQSSAHFLLFIQSGIPAQQMMLSIF